MALLDRNPPRPAHVKGCQYVVRAGDAVEDGVHVLRFGERRFPVGDVFPHVELGLHEIEAVKLYRAGFLEVAVEHAAASRPLSPDDPPLSDVRISADEVRAGEPSIEQTADAPAGFVAGGSIAVESSASQRVAFIARPSERIDVRTPQQRDHKRRR